MALVNLLHAVARPTQRAYWTRYARYWALLLVTSGCYQPGYGLMLTPDSTPAHTTFEVRDPSWFWSEGPFRVEALWVYTCAAYYHEHATTLAAGTVWDVRAASAPPERDVVRVRYGAGLPAYSAVRPAVQLRVGACYVAEVVVRASQGTRTGRRRFTFSPGGLTQRVP